MKELIERMMMDDEVIDLYVYDGAKKSASNDSTHPLVEFYYDEIQQGEI